MNDTEKLQQYFFFGLLTIILGLNFLVFYPYLGALIFAATFASIFQPWHSLIYKRLPNLPNIAVLITLFSILLAIIAPLFFIGNIVVNQARDLYNIIIASPNFEYLVDGFLASTKSEFSKIPVLSLFTAINKYAQVGLEYFLNNAGAFFSGATDATVNFFLILLAMFFFLRDGAKLKTIIMRLSPLRNEDDQMVLDHFERVIHSIIKGSLFMALIQGLVATIGFAIFGIPNFFLWGAVSVVASLIPGIGSAIVTVPAAIFLFSNNLIGASIGMAIWAFLVSVIDNLLRPRLIAGDLGIHPLLVFLSVLGGLTIFGTYGFLIGPLLLSFLFALAQLYKKEFSK